MNSEYFDMYEAAAERGVRGEAKLHLLKFIETIVEAEDQKEWTRHYLENKFKGDKIRHELYEFVIFPVLLDGYLKADPWSLKWLAETIQNLYQCHSLWEKVGRKSDFELLRELLRLCPDNRIVAERLLSRTIEWFDYTQHEWPAGILYGANGASVDECDDIIEEIARARTLDAEHQYSDFLNDYEEKVHKYRETLISAKKLV